MGIVYYIVEAIPSVVPEERFAPLEIETTTALPVKGVDRSSDLFKAQVFRPATGELAVSTS
jgi:hypothetical protein